jgi:hypothetical protein
VPDAQVPDAQVPDAQVPDAQVPDAQVPGAGGATHAGGVGGLARPGVAVEDADGEHLRGLPHDRDAEAV